MDVSALEAEILEPLVEPCQLTASVYQTVCTTCPRWVAVWIYIEFNGVPGTAPSRSGGKGTPISHFDSDFMVLRVNLFLHFTAPNKLRMLYEMAQ